MSNYFGKQTSSKIVNAQVIQLSSAVAVNSSPFGSQTYQIRVISPIATWIAIGASTVSAAVQSAGSVFLAANTASGDYFTVTPGQTISCISLSSASTGTVSVVEMG
jgi:hypothetical protein